MKLRLNTLIFLLLVSCGDTDFSKFSELGDLRIMGVVVDTPEVDGTSSTDTDVTLTPYISDLGGRGREFTVTVVTCLDPGVTQGAEAVCDTPQVETYPNANSFDTSTLSSADYTGAMDPITITISNPASLIAEYSAQKRYNGVNYLIFFNIASGSKSINVVKAIPITDRGTLNTNPVIRNITFNGSTLNSGPTRDGELDINFTSGSERFSEMRFDGSIDTRSESFLITWFYTRGKVKPGRMLESQSSSYTSDNSEAITLVAVVKDRRGGTAVRILAK